MQEFTYECYICGAEFTELAHIGRAEESPHCPQPDCTGTGIRVYEMPEVVFAEHRDPISILIGALLGIGAD